MQVTGAAARALRRLRRGPVRCGPAVAPPATRNRAGRLAWRRRMHCSTGATAGRRKLTTLAGALDLVPPGPREVRITLVAPDGTAETMVRESRVGIDD